MAASVIPGDIAIDAALAKKLISGQLGIDINSCRLLGEGFDNKVFLINDHLVFRFPRRHVAIHLIEHEMRLLPKLAPVVPARIPIPLYIGTKTQDYPAPFYGHEILPGHTGCTATLSLDDYEQLAGELGLFLKTLHHIDTKSFGLNAELLQPVFDRTDKQQMFFWTEERWHSVKENFDVAIYEEKVNTIVNEALNYVPKQDPLVLVHSDLYHRHLLFDDSNNLVGVIDWGDSCLSDRVVDFSVIYQFLPAAVHEAFFAIYGPVSKAEQQYARFLGLYYIVAMLWFGHDRKDTDLINSSLKALDRI